MGILFYSTTVASHFLSARLTQNFDVQQTYLLNVTRVSVVEGKVSSTFFNYSQLKFSISRNTSNLGSWQAEIAESTALHAVTRNGLGNEATRIVR